MKKNSFNYKPVAGAELVQKFIQGVEKDIEKYFNNHKGCIVGLEDEGVFYGEALYQWLKPGHKNLQFTSMDDDGEGLDENKAKESKILIVDNDIITGKAYKKTMEAIRLKKERLKIKDIKYAVLRDRLGLADFVVQNYTTEAPWGLEELDALDVKIIQALSQDGRKSFVEIAKKTGLSAVTVKNRVTRLANQKILKIEAMLNIEKFYSMSVIVQIEADEKTILQLVEKFEKSQMVYLLVRSAGRYNLTAGIVAAGLDGIEDFISREIRANAGVKHIEVNIGELPIRPRGLTIPESH